MFGLFKHTSFIWRLWLGIDGVQWEASFSRNIKFADRKSVHLLIALILISTTLKFLETFGNVQCDIDQHTIDLRLHLVGSEEDVGFEVVNRFVDDVLFEIGAARCWPSELSSYWEDCHVGD